jgi:NAD(P)-dependent dehydrogenase (short-subunit alcohol dehydrogenase family)
VAEESFVDLKGRVAFITGSTKGIGAATAVELARRGADVGINGRHEDEEAKDTLDRVRSLGTRAELILGDCSNPTEALRCVEITTERLGPPTVIVHSAGGPVPGTILEITPEDWMAAFDIHIHAVFHLCRAVIPIMQRSKEGVIILISSAAGLRGCPGAVGYQAVKGALPQIARALARDHAKDNIRVNVVAPGIIRTRFHQRMTPEAQRHNLDNRIPLGREGSADQVAHLIAELVVNDYITGETVSIDGGLTMKIA